MCDSKAVIGSIPPVPAAIVEVPPTNAAPLPAATTESVPAPKPSRDVETLYLFRRALFMDAATDRSVKTGPGVVRRVIVGSAPVATDGVLTLRDGAAGSGRVLAQIVSAAGQPYSVTLDAPFEKALNIVLAGAAPGNFTVVWE